MITKEDRILIKNLLESKNYEAKRLISEFPKKKRVDVACKISCTDYE